MVYDIYNCRIKGKEYFNYANNKSKSEKNSWNHLLYEDKFFNKDNCNVKTNI